jgi:hypothetical protein
MTFWHNFNHHNFVKQTHHPLYIAEAARKTRLKDYIHNHNHLLRLPGAHSKLPPMSIPTLRNHFNGDTTNSMPFVRQE